MVKKKCKTSFAVRKRRESNQERNVKYRELRFEYLQKHSVCEVCLKSKSKQIHHKARRKGLNLFRFFLAVCPKCHMWIHDHSQEAKVLGYIFEYDPNKEDDLSDSKTVDQ